MYLVHSGDLNLALDNKEEEEEGGNNDEEKEEDKTNNKKDRENIQIRSIFLKMMVMMLVMVMVMLHGTPKKIPRPG